MRWVFLTVLLHCLTGMCKYIRLLVLYHGVLADIHSKTYKTPTTSNWSVMRGMWLRCKRGLILLVETSAIFSLSLCLMLGFEQKVLTIVPKRTCRMCLVPVSCFLSVA